MRAKSLRFLTSTSLFLSVNASAAVALGFFLYGRPIAPEIILAVFFATFSVYGLNKVTDKVEDSVNKPSSVSKNTKYYTISSGLAMILCLTIGVLDGPFVFSILLLPLVMGFIYSVKIAKTLPRLKEIVGIKSIVVALSWATTGALLPACFGQVQYDKIFLFFMFIFLQIMVNTILYDTLDLEGDRVSGVLTIPMVLGSRNTKEFLVAINTSMVVWLGFCILKGMFIEAMPALVFGVLYGYAIIWFLNGKHHLRPIAELMIDGEWLQIFAVLRLIVH